MKRIGTLNRHLSRLIASMGHTDQLVICDSGLPIPRNAECVDLALTNGIPRFLDVVKVILEEIKVEKFVVAKEMKSQNTDLLQSLQSLLPDISMSEVTHEQFKEMMKQPNTAFVRTGECTPYANVILISGVTF